MVSSYQADVVVEIAFGSGYSTPAASRSWTDVSAYVELAEGITISGGRQNERSQADANQLSLTLDNSSGRFTAGLASGAYYPNVKLDVPIRVRADPVDGADSTRFVGYVNEWPVEWDGTSAYAKATITASSRISRLGYTRGLPSIIEQAILTDSPVAYYTMGEPEGSTQANDLSGYGGLPLTLANLVYPLTFGSATGPGTDSLTAVQFDWSNAGNQYLRGGSVALATAATVEAFFAFDTVVPGADVWMLYLDSAALLIGVNTSGQLFVAAPGGTVTGATSVCDGAVRHVAATLTTTTLTVYVDGVSIGSVGVSVAFASFGTLSVGLGLSAPIFVPGPGPASASHVAVFSSVLSAPQILSHATAGLTGYAGEVTDDRLERYAGYAGILAAEVNEETGSTTMAHVDTTDKQVLDLLRIVETTEGGVLYDERDGTLTFHNRAHRYNVSSLFTLDMSEQEVEADYRLVYDRTYILNDVSANDVTGNYAARKTDPTSLLAYGPMTASIETASQDDDAPLNLASWTVAAYKDPAIRVPTCSVNALAQVGKTPNCSAVMAATVGNKITVSNHPTQAPASSATYFIEGWTEVYGPESLTITWNLSPTSPWDLTLIIGDGTRGVIGTYPIAY